MSPIRRIARAKKFLVAAALASAVAIGAILVAIVDMRRDAIGIATSHIDDMATVLADDVANSIASVDLILRDATDIARSKASGSTMTEADARSIRASLVQRRSALEQTAAVGVANASGEIVSAAADISPGKVNIGDREYFTAQRDGLVKGLFVSKPLQNKVDGRTVIFFSRPIAALDGQFLGVAFVALEPGQLFRHHDNLMEGNERSYSLFYEDGTVAFREPYIPDTVGKVVSHDTQGLWARVVKAGGGVFQVQGMLDPRPRFVATRPVPGSSFFVNVGVTESSILASWRARAITLFLSALTAQALIGLLIVSQTRLARRLGRSRVRAWMRAKRLKANAEEFAQARYNFALSLDYLSQGIAIYDGQGRLVLANRCYAELYGLEPPQLPPGIHWREVLELRIANGASGSGTPGECGAVAERERLEGEDYHELRNGRILLARARATQEGGLVTVHEDVTERVRSARELAYAASHDNLTQLANRKAFKDVLASMFQSPSAKPFGLLLADIDGFKEVNDTYGQEIGDLVLVEIANRFAAAVREGLVARLAGDEFAAVLPCQETESSQLNAVAERVVQAVRQPIFMSGRNISLRASVAIKIVNPGNSDVPTAIRRAYLALYVAKAAGGNCIRSYDPEMETDFNKRALLEHDLREAIMQERLEVHYQPIVSAREGRIVCMEALARWRHPTRGMISPAVFIPLAEESGLINAIGDFVLRRACRDAAKWRSEIVVAVNVSSLQLERPDYLGVITTVLEDAKLRPHRLQLEITESVLLRNNDVTTRHMRALRGLGVTFALDDFGTGYASLAYLKTFHLDKIKIDKTFVDDICVDPQSMAIVGAIVGLASSLGVDTTAEGVETREQYEALRAIGVATIQGYYFCKPKAIGDHDRAAIFDGEAGGTLADTRAA